ncbi:unnamed protein product [Agarophyton chilense]
MSFFDITGLIGSLVTLRDELEKLRDRYKTLKNDIPRAISEITSSIAECSSDLENLNAQLAHTKHIENQTLKHIERQLKQISSLCSESFETLCDVNQKLSSRLYGFFRARKIADFTLGPLQSRFATAVGELNELNGMFAIIHVVEGSKDEVVCKMNEQHPRAIEDVFKIWFMERSGPDLSCQMETKDSYESLAKTAVLEAELRKQRLVVLQGGPGMGKTSTLCALSRDKDVRFRFVDGVYWISLGMSATVCEFIHRLSGIVASAGGKSVSKRINRSLDEAIAVEEACSWFHAKRFLFLVDDVWKGKDFDASFISLLHDLALAGSGSALVYTTRQVAMIGNSMHIQFCPRNTYGLHSQSILNSSAGVEVDGVIAMNQTYQKLLCLCGGIPFPLAVAGRALSRLCLRNLTFLEAVEEFVRRLDIEEDILTARIDGYRSLTVQFKAALGILDENLESLTCVPQDSSLARLYISLAVLEKQQFVPLSMLQHLWGVSFQNTYDIANGFDGVGIAHLRYESTDIGAMKIPGLRLNDLAHDFILSEGKGFITTFHRELVESYRSLLTNEFPHGKMLSPWWQLVNELKDEGYFSRNLVRHLDESGMRTELAILLSHPNWFFCQLNSGGILQIESEIARIYPNIDGVLNQGSDVPLVLNSKGLEYLSWAARLSWSAIADNPREKWFQIHGRLLHLAENNKTISEYIHKIQKHASKPWLKSILNCLSSPGGKRKSFVSIATGLCCMVQLNDDEVVCGCVGGEVSIINLRYAKVMRQWTADQSRMNVYEVVIPRDRSALLLGLWDGTFQLLEGPNWTLKKTLSRHESFVCSMGLTDDKRFMLSTGYEFSMRLWDMEKGIQLGNAINAYEGGSEGINGGAKPFCITAVPGDHSFIVSGDDHILRRLDVRLGTPGENEVIIPAFSSTDDLSFYLSSAWRIESGD